MNRNGKIIITIIIVIIAVAIIGLALYFNPDWPKNKNDDQARFKRAIDRTYTGFEKEKNSKWLQDFFFIQGTDPQFGLMEQMENPNVTIISSNWTREIDLLRKAVSQWNELKPRFVVITGDLVNDPPLKNNSRRRQQLDDLKTELGKLNESIPLILLSGNHDLGNKPSKEALKEYNDEFGDDYFSFWVDGVMFIVINSQFYKEPKEMPDEYKKQNQWLDKQLEDAIKNNYTHVILFQHIPWFNKAIDEKNDDEYFTISLEERTKMIPKLYDAGIRFIFAGHQHRNFYGKYNDLNMITTSAIGYQWENADKSGYRRINITQNMIEHEYIEIES